MLIMTTYWQLRGQAVVWPGVTKVSLMTAAQVQARRYLADMAAKGNWQRVIQDLNPDNHLLDVNQWRPGDASWTTVLHEAAKQGAPLDVVSWLINRGALRSQRDAEGKRGIVNTCGSGCFRRPPFRLADRRLRAGLVG